MASIKEEIAAIAADHGYTGPKPKSTAGAIDALADTLAGTDVKSGRSIAGAIHALAPYIGSGGGGSRVELFNETVTTEAGQYGNMARLAFIGEITDDPLHVVFDGVEYDLPRLERGNYGAMSDGHPDFSTYPLFLGYSSDNQWTLLTETAGTHTVAAYGKKLIPKYEIIAIGEQREIRIDSKGKLDSLDSFLHYGDVYDGYYGTNDDTNVGTSLGYVQGGLWVAVSLVAPTAEIANNLSVFYSNGAGGTGGELPNVSKWVEDDTAATLSFQVPSEFSAYESLAITTPSS